tara:strand:+ start:891 stop:2087 length:1197 start_codon:yes stop_codon:yes gene_type:complete
LKYKFQKNLSDKKIALIHDWYSSKYRGGAEKALEIINSVLINNFTQPELYGLVEDISKSERSWLTDKKINTSFINKLPFSKNHFHKYFPLFPLAIENLDLSEYDLIISSSHFAAKGVLTSPDQLHLSYIHTPVRYAWDQMHTYLKNSKLNRLGLSFFIKLIMHNLRLWDQSSSQRIDKICTNSNFTAKRIKKYWGRDSEVIFGPVEVSKYDPKQERDNFYLSVCRLVPNKRVDLIVKAFNKLDYPLVIVGEGPEKSKIKEIATSNIKIMGYQDDQKIKELMQNCRGFIYAGVEDFGITPVEAMAAGAPVIGLNRGGLIDTVNCLTSDHEFKTGILFNYQNADCIYDTINWFEQRKAWRDFCPKTLHQWSQNFSTEKFYLKFNNFLSKSLEEFKNKTIK